MTDAVGVISGTGDRQEQKAGQCHSPRRIRECEFPLFNLRCRRMRIRDFGCVFGQQLTHRIALIIDFYIRFDSAAECVGALFDVRGTVLVDSPPRQDHETPCQHADDGDKNQP